MPDIARINDYLQRRLQRELRQEITAVDAAKWLDQSGLLRDRPQRPGLPLRNLLRAGLIQCAEQRPAQPYGRWWIRRCELNRGPQA